LKRQISQNKLKIIGREIQNKEKSKRNKLKKGGKTERKKDRKKDGKKERQKERNTYFFLDGIYVKN